MVKQNKYRLTIFGFAFYGLIVGCSQPTPLKTVTWNKNSGLDQPQFLEKKESQNTVQIKYLNEIVSRNVLTYKGVEIEGSYVQKILNSKNEFLFIKSEYSENHFSHLDAEISRSLKNKYISLLQFKSKFQDLKNAVYVWDPRLTIVLNNYRPFLLWVIDYQSPYNLGAHRMKITLGGSQVENSPIGSSFDYQAVIYPMGPKFSDLSEVILDNLFGNGFLMSSGVKVFNDLKEQAQGQNGKFVFQPQDSRFNQVQTYYFIDQHLKYYLSKHQLQLPFALEARVNVTAPDGRPTTYTGYVHQRITLGAGDAVIWNHIPQDPSIVMHETSHAIVEALSGLSYEGEEGSLNEAYADFLTASHLNNPQMGNIAYLKSPFKRTLETVTLFSEKNGMKYHDSLIVSGALWEMRKSIGTTNAEKLALLSLSRLGPKSQILDFGQSVRMALKESFSEKEQQDVLQTLNSRGF
ncbi:MAG TPA: hypothetical protein PLJ21_12910 [Pseudobdellovibrionaceae bacterium]|nr:hypothetical protein [Pseudobdellovibrionaceae bacterium]